MSSEEPARCIAMKRKAGLLDEPTHVQPKVRKKMKQAKASEAKFEKNVLLLSVLGFHEVTRYIMLEVDAEESVAAAAAADDAPHTSTRFKNCALQTLQHTTEFFLRDIVEDVRDDVIHSKPCRKRATTEDFIRVEAALRPGARSQNSKKLRQAWRKYCGDAAGHVDMRNKCKRLSEKGFNRILQCGKSFQVKRGDSKSARESVPDYLRFATSCFVRDVLRASGFVMRLRTHGGQRYCMRSDDIKKGVKQAFGRIAYEA